MCGRVTLDFDINELRQILERAFNVTQVQIDDYDKRYNIAPSQPLLSIINDGNENRAGYIKWGFIPPFVNSLEGFKPIINTRSETAHTKPSFKGAMSTKRCLILASSFYEWDSKSGVRTPYNVKVNDQSIIPMAGLWSTYKKEDGSSLYTCSILTTAANEMMKRIHHRMPVILDPESSKTWLDRSIKSPDKLTPILKAYDPNHMTMYPVSTLVNNVQIDSIECVQPLP